MITVLNILLISICMICFISGSISLFFIILKIIYLPSYIDGIFFKRPNFIIRILCFFNKRKFVKYQHLSNSDLYYLSLSETELIYPIINLFFIFETTVEYIIEKYEINREKIKQKMRIEC